MRQAAGRLEEWWLNSGQGEGGGEAAWDGVHGGDTESPSEDWFFVSIKKWSGVLCFPCTETINEVN